MTVPLRNHTRFAAPTTNRRTVTMDDHLKRRILEALSRRGYVRAVVLFSGGNDSGGVDQIKVTKEDGTTTDLGLPPPVVTKGWTPDGWTTLKVPVCRTWKDGKPNDRPATDTEIIEHDFHRLLAQPVYDAWGGFAGDYYVSGKYIYDVDEDTIRLGQDVEVPRSEHSEDSW
jgi:hypothetical protein